MRRRRASPGQPPSNANVDTRPARSDDFAYWSWSPSQTQSARAAAGSARARLHYCSLLPQVTLHSSGGCNAYAKKIVRGQAIQEEGRINAKESDPAGDLDKIKDQVIVKQKWHDLRVRPAVAAGRLPEAATFPTRLKPPGGGECEGAFGGADRRHRGAVRLQLPGEHLQNDGRIVDHKHVDRSEVSVLRTSFRRLPETDGGNNVGPP